MAQLMPMLDQLSDTQLDQLLQLVQYLQDNEEQYPEIRKKLIAEGMGEEDLPPEYDPEYFAAIGTVVLEAIRVRSAAAGTPPQQFARGGIAQAAHMLASKGRGQDTQLAHITPAEARMLRKKGGVGTINPDTGLPEFGLWGSIVGAVKSTWKAVTGAVKSILKSPVGRFLSTVALSTFIGYPAASAVISLASGENLKTALISAGTAWLAGPTSPLSGVATKAASAILPQAANAAVRQGLASTIVGTGIGLATGKSLSDSVKSGLTTAALSYGAQQAQNAFPSPMKSLGLKTDVTGREMRGEGPVPIEDRLPPPKVFGQPDMAALSGTPPTRPTFTGMAGTPPPASLPGVTAQAPAFATQGPSTAAGGPMADTIPRIGETSYQTAGAGAGIRAIETPAISGTSTGAGLRPPANALGVSDLSAGTSAFPRIQQISAATPTPSGGIPDIRTAAGEMYQGMKDLDYEKFSKGAGDLFMPGTPSSSSITGSQQFKDLTSQGISADKAYTMVEKSMTPGMLRTYGPGVAAGLGVMGLTGGFNQDNPQVDLDKFWGPSSADLMKANPRKYYIQNIPGVTYSQQGAVVPRGYEDGGTVTPDPLDPKNFMVGTEYASPQFTMDDIRVATPTLEQREAEMANYTPVTSTMTATTEPGINNPAYQNISKMYQDVLGRAPDAEGMKYWMSTIGADRSISPEDKAAWMNAAQPEVMKDPNRWLKQSYQDILGRAPDEAGLKYWMDTIGADKSISPEERDQWLAEAYKEKPPVSVADKGYEPSESYDEYMARISAEKERQRLLKLKYPDLSLPRESSETEDEYMARINAKGTGTAPFAVAEKDLAGLNMGPQGIGKLAPPVGFDPSRTKSTVTGGIADIPTGQQIGLTDAPGYMGRGTQPIPTSAGMGGFNAANYTSTTGEPIPWYSQAANVALPDAGKARAAAGVTSAAAIPSIASVAPAESSGGFSAMNFSQPWYMQPANYNMPDAVKARAVAGLAAGGIADMAPAYPMNTGGYPRRTGQIAGPGTEKSDSIPAMLSDGEFVMTARAVRGMGKGSRRDGAKKMYALMHQLEKNASRG
jgi:hypothetical protein